MYTESLGSKLRTDKALETRTGEGRWCGRLLRKETGKEGKVQSCTFSGSTSPRHPIQKSTFWVISGIFTFVKVKRSNKAARLNAGAVRIRERRRCCWSALFQAPTSSADNETGSLVQWGCRHNFSPLNKGLNICAVVLVKNGFPVLLRKVELRSKWRLNKSSTKHVKQFAVFFSNFKIFGGAETGNLWNSDLQLKQTKVRVDAEFSLKLGIHQRRKAIERFATWKRFGDQHCEKGEGVN